jgi:hypothetical protein
MEPNKLECLYLAYFFRDSLERGWPPLQCFTARVGSYHGPQILHQIMKKRVMDKHCLALTRLFIVLPNTWGSSKVRWASALPLLDCQKSFARDEHSSLSCPFVIDEEIKVYDIGARKISRKLHSGSRSPVCQVTSTPRLQTGSVARPKR